MVLVERETYNVVDLEDGAHRFGGERDGADGDEQRLRHALLHHVADRALAHVDAGRGEAERVLVAQVRHRGDRVQARVLGQRRRNHLESHGISLERRCWPVLSLWPPVLPSSGAVSKLRWWQLGNTAIVRLRRSYGLGSYPLLF